MKNGLDYFPFDAVLDDKFELIEAEFGLTGFGVVVKIFQKIYGGHGYYIEWTNEVALLFAKRIGAGGNVVSQIVDASIRRGIFDKTMFKKYGILTSNGIQKRYFEAVSRRKNIDVRPEYLLGSYAQKFKNVNNSDENADIFCKNADILQQRKEEKSKVNIHSFTHSNARAENTAVEKPVENLDSAEKRRTYLGGIGKNVVFLSDEQMENLLKELSLAEFDYYVGVVADCELRGQRFKKKTHYQAILDMAEKDRRIGHEKTDT